MSETSQRRGIRLASRVFLIGSGMHAVLHYRFYVDTASMDASRRAVMRYLQGVVVVPRFGTTMWTILCMFSLCFAILLALTGTAYWWMAKDLPAARLRPLATASAWLCLGSTALVAGLYPVLHAVLILLLASLGFCYAAWFARPRGP
ncbi:hypothetical protein [Tahibacter amnicola]|uniref:PepSY-associated transmembrane protein n=1 Tax=Tahibacter amnicola TaxID=2976241 RepID=A0ABY6BIE3_9GAMM|nr:hypothetical protein [Tahibacter amnicola]UXI68140.1 hypothetical protein N4264_00360 [Tahibacter amnicola]